ncbi:MAG TPA: CehA/McbA family metallohydrolase [Methylomirabilota bacterium]|nr:CehA/McbA family metallohydrolase [Methylomirabilota bacterium]
MRYRMFVLSLCALAISANALPLVTNVDVQPLHAQAVRVEQALAYLGAPLSADEIKELNAAPSLPAARAVEKIQTILDRHVLFGVNINPEMRVKVQAGAAKPELDEQGWRVFLVKVANESGTTAKLVGASPNAQRLFNSPSNEVGNRWLDLAMFDSQPLAPTLSGLTLEYRIISLYSRDTGKREAKFSFNVGQGTQDIGFRNEVDLLFTCRPAHEVTLRVRDENGQPTTASFTISDKQGRVYPSMSKRLAPDFAFHPQVYRADGENVRLPDGEYIIDFVRGPESIAKQSTHRVSKDARELSFAVERWIDPAKFGWWSGDHHIHAAGCAHYTKPSEGVFAEDMIRHCMGEDLKIGANLTWGPCFDFQKQFFCGGVDKVSQYPYLLRYDIEVSGFGSHQSGHLCLLRLKEQMFPGGESKHHWPTLGLNTLKWAKKQGAVTGPAHSGNGIQISEKQLPSYEIPKYNGIGANEFVVDITHEVPGPDGKPVPAIDFISTVDTDPYAELNMWYHSLNAGFRVRASGETDFPCIYGERVGIGRSYVKLDGRLNYDDWCEGIRLGRNYVSDGFSHLIDFKANEVSVGENGSELKLQKSGSVRLQAKVAAWLGEKPARQRFVWQLEKARLGATRNVPLEVVVNGHAVARMEIVADGKLQDLSFDVPIEQSSWVALRIFPSSHSNPIFVMVNDKPIRDRKSIEWCLKGVDQCWSQKKRTYQESEMEEAVAAYDHARKVYQARLAEAQEQARIATPQAVRLAN